MNPKTYNKTVGIYMPTHNRVDLLKKAIESILCQTYQDFKLIIVDDGSEDSTQQFLDSLSDPRINYIRHEKPLGACSARNTAIEALDTELITGLDDDDEFLPNRLERLLDVYSEDFSFVCSGYYWDYGVHKKALFAKNKQVTLSDAIDLSHCSNQILVKRERVLAVGGYDVNIPALQDYDLWIRLIAKFGDAFRIGEPLYVVNSDNNIEHISSVKNKLKAITIFEEKHESLMSTRHRKNFDFYKKRMTGDRFGITDLIKSSKYGLLGIKLRLFFSRYFRRLSTLRLNYLQSGSFVEALKNEFKDSSFSNSVFIKSFALILIICGFVYFFN